MGVIQEANCSVMSLRVFFGAVPSPRILLRFKRSGMHESHLQYLHDINFEKSAKASKADESDNNGVCWLVLGYHTCLFSPILKRAILEIQSDPFLRHCHVRALGSHAPRIRVSWQNLGIAAQFHITRPKWSKDGVGGLV